MRPTLHLPHDVYLTIGEAAAVLGVHSSTVSRRIQASALTALAIPTSGRPVWRVEAASVHPALGRPPLPLASQETWSAGQVSTLLRLTPRCVRALARQGRLPLRRGRHGWVCHRADLQRFIVDHTQEQEQEPCPA